jgi:uncharacterized membrane protein YoaK (UPF0700 family)
VKGVLLRTSDRLLPSSADIYGPLPALLVVLTFVTGVVDAVSYLGLGHVFVANMTGNVIFFAFSLSGAEALSLWASALAIGAFMAGAWGEARIAGSPDDTVRRFRLIVGVQALLVSGAAVTAATLGHRSTGAIALLIILLGCGMGLQNAVVRRLAVPDLTTTVLTLTVTGLASDRPGRSTVRRLTSIAAMLCGALCGGALTLHAGIAWALLLVLILLLAVAATASTPTERNLA